MLDRLFRLKERGTTAGRELVAGLTTFAAMAYILAANPNILKNAGMPEAALVTATALSASIATALMAFWTNFPARARARDGINAFFAFSICIGMRDPVAKCAGLGFHRPDVYFLLLSITGVREDPRRPSVFDEDHAVSAGIGLFIAFIGLKTGFDRGESSHIGEHGRHLEARCRYSPAVFC
jgi:AGZA family xanthine/uracil permease-like MFS transporter